MDVLSVASEFYPLIKTGGLADVVGSLPAALAAEGIAMRTLLPGYPAVLAGLREAQTVVELPGFFGGMARLLAGHADGAALFVLEAPHLYARPGGPYVDATGQPWADNAFRFAALSRAGALLCRGLVPAFRPQIAHVHDWQTGLLPAYLALEGGWRPGTVMTVHNLAFQGQFPAMLLPALGLPPHAFGIDGVEYYGDIGFLKSGLRFADRITTVSPSYAAEIRTPEFGMGMDGLLRGRSGVLGGILNGIDTQIWDPATDPLLPAHFSAEDLAGRAACKRALQRRLGLIEDAAAPLFGVVSRITWQKGLDLLLGAIPTLLRGGAQLALLGGPGEAWIASGFADAAAGHPGRIAAYIGYEEDLAHLMQAGIDALLVPSRFEPCGLTQLCALRYGAVPVVARTGGLADTVIDANPMALASGVATGVQFSPASVEMLEAAIIRTLALHADAPCWRQMQARGMATDVSWRGPARAYAALFRDLHAERVE